MLRLMAQYKSAFCDNNNNNNKKKTKSKKEKEVAF